MCGTWCTAILSGLIVETLVFVIQNAEVIWDAYSGSYSDAMNSGNILWGAGN